MNNVNDWFYFTEGLDKKTCNKIKKIGTNKWENSKVDTKPFPTEEERKIGIKVIPGENKEDRISDVAWTNEQWLYDTIWPVMEKVNDQAGWKYDIRSAENMQITRYQKGGFYRFHSDGRGDHLSTYDEPKSKFKNGFVRKISMTILLNENFEGGEFQFSTYTDQKCYVHSPPINKTGSIIVFPSYMEHRVKPITKGTRYSLVTWFLGPPFR